MERAPIRRVPRRLIRLAATALIAASLLGCGGSKGDADRGPVALAGAGVPAEHQGGEAAFNKFCLPCHGPSASGTARGPTFIHRIYEPNHHGDEAFMRASQMGVRAHHWQFGDMPKIDGVSETDLRQIIGYIRWLQRQAGIK